MDRLSCRVLFRTLSLIRYEVAQESEQKPQSALYEVVGGAHSGARTLSWVL